ncbi:NAD-dependent epimerase/dehydratase family protein, partial [Ferrimicrobium acidiphilum]
MKIIVFGGDGFCGWPTALHLSSKGHEVVIVDNLSRRKIDIEMETESLTPISPLSVRIAAWREVSGLTIRTHLLDLAGEFDRLRDLLITESPDAVVHFAEQRSAPYSMRSVDTKRYTVDNNIRATHNLLAAIADTDLPVHLVHLGTMGVYGYGWSDDSLIPEGYLE